MVEPIVIVGAIGGVCTLIAGFGGQWIGGRRERKKAKRERLSNAVDALSKEIDLFAEKATEWWALTANEPTIPNRRAFLVARSARLGQDFERLIAIQKQFSDARPLLGALRDAATLGPFDDNSRPADAGRAAVIYDRANGFRDALHRILDQHRS